MIKVGDRIPDATLKHLTASGIEDVSTTDVFKGRKVALFAVPGAFTPTCAQQHLPDYIANAAKFREKGLDDVVCLAVNDPFVMKAWGDKSEVGDAVTMLADGNGELTKAMGLDFDGSGVGLGTRCKRFSAYLDDGVFKVLEVEDNPGVVSVSGAERLLNLIEQA